MARRTNDPFDFSKARGSSGRTAFRTPQMSRTMFTPQDLLAQKQASRNQFIANMGPMSQQAVSPYKALAFYFAKLARAGLDGADEFSALNRAAAKSATTARRIGATERQAGLGLRESETILKDHLAPNPRGYSSKLFEDGVRQLFKPTEVEAILRSFSKLQGTTARRIYGYSDQLVAAGGTPGKVAMGFNTAVAAGRILRRGITDGARVKK